MIAVISVTEKGDSIGEILKKSFNADLFLKTKIKGFKLKTVTKEVFNKYEKVVFISSTGIAVRAIDGLIEKKDKDPAVIVVDVCNRFTISLLSGHLGGANNLALEISKVLKNTPVITTGTDNLNVVAPDVLAKDYGLTITSFKEAKNIASRLVNNKEVFFRDDRNEIPLPKGYIETRELRSGTVWITDSNKEIEGVLKLVRKDILLGIGCRRDTPFEKLKNMILEGLDSLNLSYESVKYIGSIDIKKDEIGLLEIADFLKAETRFFKATEIKSVQDEYEGSNFVERITGVKCVSEPSLKLLGGKQLKPLEKRDGVTLTIGRLEKGI